MTGRRFRDAMLLPMSAIVLLIVWELLVDLLHVPNYVVPAPSSVAVAAWRMTQSGLLLDNAVVTLVETLAGFAAAFVLAAVLAILISEFHFCERLIYPYIVALQSMPKVAVGPLIVIWFGFGLSSKIALSALLAMFPMLVNFVQGLRAAEPGRLKLLRALDASRWQVLWLVRIPYALPFFLAGLELGAIYAMLGAIVGEFLGSSSGLGNWLLAMNMNLDISGSFALLVLLALYGIALQRLVGMLRRRVLFWAQQDVQRSAPAETGGTT
jgi:NitT/TauT family transport system permease protein